MGKSKGNAAAVGAQGRVIEDGPDLSHIAEPLRALAVSIDTLVPDPENARLHPEENLDAIVRSLDRFGQDQPLVVQRQGMIVRKGNGRLAAAKRLGWKSIAAVIVDEDNIDAAARAIADNRTAELAQWDERVLLKTMAAWKEAKPEAKTTELGFREDVLAAMAARVQQQEAEAQAGEIPAPQAPQDFPSIGEDLHTDYQCPKCSYTWSGKPK